MKLRLKGNSIRFRLTRAEVEQLAGSGVVEEFVEFGDESFKFAYAIRKGPEGSAITATFDGSCIRVHVPADILNGWANSDEVGIENEVRSGLRILVEKDFACLSARPGEDESDMFPNPATVSC